MRISFTCVALTVFFLSQFRCALINPSGSVNEVTEDLDGIAGTGPIKEVLKKRSSALHFGGIALPLPVSVSGGSVGTTLPTTKAPTSKPIPGPGSLALGRVGHLKERGFGTIILPLPVSVPGGSVGTTPPITKAPTSKPISGPGRLALGRFGLLKERGFGTINLPLPVSVSGGPVGTTPPKAPTTSKPISRPGNLALGRSGHLKERGHRIENKPITVPVLVVPITTRPIDPIPKLYMTKPVSDLGSLDAPIV